MKYVVKSPRNGFFRLMLIFLFIIALLSGCGSDSSSSNDDNSSDNGIEDSDDTAPQPVDSNSSIVVNPSTIPSDGESTATVTVTLNNEEGQPVADGTEVTLVTTMGSIISDNPAATSGGNAQFTVQAPDFSGAAELFLAEFTDISRADLYFGSTGTGNPASIQIESVSPSEIAVTGVGEPDQATVSLHVVDEVGNSIDGSDYALEISFLARTDGWEKLTEGGAGSDNSDYEAITIGINDGYALFHVQSGSEPGVLNLLARVLDETGQPLDPAVRALIPGISVASGPPHILSLSAPKIDGVVNLTTGPDGDLDQTPGFYSKRAGISVLDRWGNAVPDGTVINVGVMDTILASGTGDLTEEVDSEFNGILRDINGPITLTPSSINDTDRIAEAPDRVVVNNAEAHNKSRFVAGIEGDEIAVTRPYVEAENGLEYWVGASLRGSAIYGMNPDGSVTKGTVITRNGLGQLRFVYPANPNTIHLGVVEDDPRYPGPATKIASIFTCTDDSATMVDTGTLIFASIAGWTLTGRPESINETTIITLEVFDGGDEIPLPFVELTPIVEVNRDAASDLSVDAQECVTEPWTGACNSTITISGSAIESGDSAEITYYTAGDRDAEFTVSYEAP